MSVSFDELAELIRSRRTHMLVDRDRDVPLDVIEQLCELVSWAPNHKKTWPWRFAAFTGPGRLRLGEAFVADMTEQDFGDEGKRTKTLTKYARTPTVLVVGTAPHDNPTLHHENRDAVAAGIQNLLLGATAIGLASFWSTPPLRDSRRALELCGFEPDDRIVGVIYLGWSAGDCQAAERPAPVVRHIDA